MPAGGASYLHSRSGCILTFVLEGKKVIQTVKMKKKMLLFPGKQTQDVWLYKICIYSTEIRHANRITFRIYGILHPFNNDTPHRVLRSSIILELSFSLVHKGSTKSVKV